MLTCEGVALAKTQSIATLGNDGNPKILPCKGLIKGLK